MWKYDAMRTALGNDMVYWIILYDVFFLMSDVFRQVVIGDIIANGINSFECEFQIPFILKLS